MTVRGVAARLALIKPVAVIVQQGKILDYIDGLTQRNETPEEYVRQEIAKSLVREYGYEKAEISVEFLLRLGSRKPRADLVIFDEGDPSPPPSLSSIPSSLTPSTNIINILFQTLH